MRLRAPQQDEQRLVFAFAAAAGSGDLAALEDLLAEDVVLWSDGGAARRAPPAVRWSGGTGWRGSWPTSRTVPHEGTVEFVHLNGDPALLLQTDAGPALALSIETDGTVILGDPTR